MSVAIDSQSEVDKSAYDREFDENHTVDERKVSTCTYGGWPGCLTCE